jgi:hypothetical protein
MIMPAPARLVMLVIVMMVVVVMIVMIMLRLFAAQQRRYLHKILYLPVLRPNRLINTQLQLSEPPPRYEAPTVSARVNIPIFPLIARERLC